MKILYTNAQSIGNKLGELTVLTTDLQPDFILLTESWTNISINDASLYIPGYNLESDLRKDREDTGNGIGGGLLVYVKEGRKILPDDSYNNIRFNQLCCFKTVSAGQ